MSESGNIDRIRRKILRYFAVEQRNTTDDAALTCVDLSTVGGFLEWYNNASDRELHALLDSTPGRCPFPGDVLFGIVNGVPDSELERVTDWTAIVVRAFQPDPSLIKMMIFDLPHRYRIQYSELHFKPDGLFSHISSAMPDDDAKLPSMIALAFCMFHVRNIILRPVKVTQAERRLIRRDHGVSIPPVTYHTLAIKPFREERERTDEKQTRKDGLAFNPLHLVRGHFAHYSDEHPLFGKYPGTFWRPSHFAGNRNDGHSRKTYTVET